MKLMVSVDEALAIASGDKKAETKLRKRIKEFAAQFYGECKLCGKPFVSKRRGRRQYCCETHRIYAHAIRRFGT